MVGDHPLPPKAIDTSFRVAGETRSPEPQAYFPEATCIWQLPPFTFSQCNGLCYDLVEFPLSYYRFSSICKANIYPATSIAPPLVSSQRTVGIKARECLLRYAQVSFRSQPNPRLSFCPSRLLNLPERDVHKVVSPRERLGHR